MRLAASLVALTAACSEPMHVSAVVTIDLPSDDPADAVVTTSAEAFVPLDEFVRDPVSGADLRLDVDGLTVAFAEDKPGHYVSDALHGYLGHIRLLAGSGARELAVGPFFTASVLRDDQQITVTLDPAVQPDELATVTQFRVATEEDFPDADPSAIAESVPPGGSRVMLKSVQVPILISRGIQTGEEGDLLAGIVQAHRRPPVPCFPGDPAPCP